MLEKLKILLNNSDLPTADHNFIEYCIDTLSAGRQLTNSDLARLNEILKK